MANVKIRPRRDTTANWNSYNPVLADGEMGFEIIGTGQPLKLKIGDGNTAWTGLTYAVDFPSIQSAASTASNAASAASTSSANAKTSETNAKASETNAASSASVASTSASNASTSASAASTSATNASSSASAAASSASAASSSASAADSAKTAAASSASAAATSASNAASSATAAANSAASLVVVNDLTTGGTTNALSAEQGKTLSASISDLSTKMTEKTSYGVYSGLGVTAQATPNMTVSVATGTIYMANGDRFAPTAVTALAVTAADATNPRIDIVYVNSTGVISYLAGTAAASPTAPSVPADGQKLAEISVAAGATTIVTANIADRRKTLTGEAWITPTMLNGWAAIDLARTPQYMKDSNGFVHLRGIAKGGPINQSIFILPIGYRPTMADNFPIISNAILGYISIATSGYVSCGSGNNASVCLGGISFRAEG